MSRGLWRSLGVLGFAVAASAAWGEPPDPTPPPPPPPSVPAPARPRTAGVGYQDWSYWYHHAEAEFQSPPRDAVTRASRARIATEVVSALRWAMDPRNAGYSDTESAAYVARAKVASGPALVPEFAKGLDLDPKRRRDKVVQESAALALGLLRRSAPGDQLPARELDDARTLLFGVLADARYGERCRGFAALAVGLLADQPTGSARYLADGGVAPAPAEDTEEARLAAEAVTLRRLVAALDQPPEDVDRSIAILTSLGLQPQRSYEAVPAARARLVDVARGPKSGPTGPDVVQAHAVTALARAGGAEAVDALRAVLASKRSGNTPARSAALGLGVLARAPGAPRRAEIATALEKALTDSKDDSVRNFALLGLGRLLAAEAAEGKTGFLTGTGPDATLLRVASEGRFYQRPFAAIALALVRRAIDPKHDRWRELEGKAIEVVRAGIDDPRMDAQGRAGFCVALGIARDGASSARLSAIVGDRSADGVLRAYAALALGLLGEPTPATTSLLADALRDRSSADLRREASVALSLLGAAPAEAGRDAAGHLLGELRSTPDGTTLGDVMLGLARIGDERAIEPLVAVLRNPRENDALRSMACACLGILGDRERTPSLARFSAELNYRASTDLIDELLSIL